MKKIYYLYAALVFALASCAGVENPEIGKGPKVKVDAEKLTEAKELEKLEGVENVAKLQDIDDIPYWSKVKDTDTCQVVKKKKMQGYLILCRGTCPAKKYPTCFLQGRKKGSKKKWKPISAPASYDKTMEYRCMCK